MLGGTIGQYRVTRLIGQGGMGAVYAGEHALLGRVAAIKVLLPDLTRNAEIVNRFFNEAKATTQIHHPGIVEIFDFGWHSDGSAYIVMELLRGESLAARLARTRLSWAHTLAIARQIAGALSAAHSAGIVHRDLKPDNVFLIEDPEVPGGERIKLLDFGIAKLAGDAGNTSKTRTGSVLGTPTYMAPEQCRGVAVDHRADLYALGCILFEAFTGRPPFMGEGSGDVLAAHIHVPAPLTSQFVQGVPPPIETLIQTLLAKQPSDRVQTARDLIVAIDTIGAPGTGSHGRPLTSPTAVLGVAGAPTTLSGAAGSAAGPHTVPPTGRASRTPWIVALAIVAAAATGIVVVSKRGEETRSAESSTTTTNIPASSPETPPVKIEPVKTEPVKTEPVKTEPVKTEPVKTEPAAAAMIDVSIDSTPPGADVWIDNKLVGKAPYAGSIEKADRDVKIVMRLSGYRDKSLTVHANAPITEKLKLEVKPKAKANRDQSVNPFGN